MVTWLGSHLSHCLPFNFTFKGCTSPRPPLFSPHPSSLRARQAVHHRILCPAKEDSTLKCFFTEQAFAPSIKSAGKEEEKEKAWEKEQHCKKPGCF